MAIYPVTVWLPTHYLEKEGTVYHRPIMKTLPQTPRQVVDGIIMDLDPDSPTFKKPLGMFWHCRVPTETDAEKYTGRVPANQVPERLRFISRLMWQRKRFNRLPMDKDEETDVENILVNLATPTDDLPRKRMFLRVLKQMRSRGLSAAKATAIATRMGLEAE